jgi:hypothetical protein
MSGLTWDLIEWPEGATGRHGPLEVLPYMHVCQRDRAAGKVLLGGLGAMRVGHMWVDDVRCEQYPGYSDAPDVNDTPGTQGDCATP